MKTCIQTLGILALAACLSYGEEAPAAPAAGKEEKRPDPEKLFKRLDSDGNGSVSLEEFKASPRGQKDPAKAEQVFKKVDADASGSVSLDEFKAHGPGPGGKGGGKGGGKEGHHKKKGGAAVQ